MKDRGETIPPMMEDGTYVCDIYQFERLNGMGSKKRDMILHFLDRFGHGGGSNELSDWRVINVRSCSFDDSLSTREGEIVGTWSF